MLAKTQEAFTAGYRLIFHMRTDNKTEHCGLNAMTIPEFTHSNVSWIFHLPCLLSEDSNSTDSSIQGVVRIKHGHENEALSPVPGS